MVSDLEKSDAGAYACVVEGVSGNRASGVVARVSVQEPPLLEQTGFLLPSSLREGLRWHSLCSVTRGDPPVSLEWLRDGRLLLPSSPAPLAPASVSPADVGIHVLHVTPFSSTLNFDRLRREHRGNYTCRASNRAGVASITRSLDVHGTLLSSLASASLLLTIASLSVAPKWLLEPRDTQAVMGKRVVMDCQADAVPAPTVSWSRDAGQSASGDELTRE